MSERSLELLAAFEALPQQEKLDFANAVFRRLPRLDSGVMNDDLIARAGDDLAAMLDAEENGSTTR